MFAAVYGFSLTVFTDFACMVYFSELCSEFSLDKIRRLVTVANPEEDKKPQTLTVMLADMEENQSN